MPPTHTPRQDFQSRFEASSSEDASGVIYFEREGNGRKIRQEEEKSKNFPISRAGRIDPKNAINCNYG